MTAMTDQETDTVRFALVITNDGRIVNNTVHATRGERRDACVAFLNRRYINRTETEDILLTFGGADPDTAVESISKLYKKYGIDVYLEDQPVPAVPVRGVPVAMYSVLQSYENSAQNTIVHFPTTEARHDHMRRQLNNLFAAVPPDEAISDTDLAARIEQTLNGLLDQRVTVHLVTSFVPNWL